MLAALTLASALAAPPAEGEVPKPPISVNGAYSVWGLTQRNFLLGAAHPLDDAGYVVQSLRVTARADREHFSVVARADAAQGWWGVDNSPDLAERPGAGEDGAVTSSTTYNPYALFGDKDTNYGVHVDLAYARIQAPGLPLAVTVGRQLHQVGHGLVLEWDAEGVKAELGPSPAAVMELSWALLSEGQGSVKAPTGAVMSDAAPYGDANLFGGRLMLAREEALKAEVYALHLRDRSGSGDAAFLHAGLGHNVARFMPDLSRLTALGLSLDGQAPLAEGLTWGAEGAWLTGSDEVDNADHGGGLRDLNDGRLSGWTAYVTATQALSIGRPARVGVTLGAGSGDDDVTGGPGNVNKVVTQGSFPFTNVWEDSVMPDVEGISPQGLGSPVSRGYREFQNTLAARGLLGVRPHERLDVAASFAWLRATRPVTGFDAAGTPTAASSRDLGWELDLDLRVDIWKGVSYSALGGIFMPGEAAALLINGSSASMDPAWEVKQVVSVAF